MESGQYFKDKNTVNRRYRHCRNRSCKNFIKAGCKNDKGT